MSIFAAAAIEIGKTIAKSVFKLWVKDSDLGTNISSSLIDLVALKTSDSLAQRKGNRQFEDIGDKISENILPLLESENITLDEGERKAVAFAAAETLNKVRLTKDILLQQNLQPSQLEIFVLATLPGATRDFSAIGTSLYHLLIKEACKYIVDIASQLPAFTEHTFAEILKREDMIRFKVDQVLEELRKIQVFLDPSDFEREYREAVMRNLDILQLIGAEVSLPNRRHKLSIAYITLSASRKLIPFTLNSSFSELGTTKELLGETVAVDVALASTSRMLIRGDAGSGKTTLLQWIAVNAAKKTFEGELAHWNGCVPFYIRLRQYAMEKLPQPEKFPEFAAPAIIGTMPSDWVHTILRSGRALLLIDGVDELSLSQRDEAHTWLQDLVATYKDSRFVVTSRPYAIEDGWMNHEAFQETTLQQMALPDIHLFIDHWHEAVKDELRTDEEKKESDTLAEYLKIHIKQTRAIRNLATNPLLCSMLCALNRDRRRQLPVNRIELYKACCTLLLDRREKESRIDLSDYPILHYSQKERLLADLAYWMTKENQTEVETTRVDASFTKRLEHMPNISLDINGKAVRRLFVERSGIIREPLLGKIDFAHKTFQEFFAAQTALAVDDIEYLVNNAHLDQWREVIILAAGLATQVQCEQLVLGLVQRGDHEQKHRQQIHLIAISCLETAIEINPEIRAEVEKRLSQLVPPKNMIEAKALAVAGELAIKHLHKKELEKKRNLSATVCAACIHTLSLIGGELALDTLEEYTKDTRDIVINEFLKSWGLFDKNVFARRLLSPMLKDRMSLRIEHVSSLEGIQYLSYLTILDLYRCDRLTDISPLATLPALTTLSLSGCIKLTDVSPLANLPTLTTLNLSSCNQLTDVSPLANLPALTTLNLYRGSQLTDVRPLANLSALTTLSLYRCDQLTDVNPLANLSALTTLNLSGCDQLADVSPLANFPALTTLDLHSCYRLTDVSPLANLSSLTTLDLSDCDQLTDVSPLANLPALITLNLSSCNQLTDVSPLANLPALTTLNLSSCDQLTNVNPLANLPALTTLNLSGCNQLTDVRPLANLPALTTLSLHRCSQLMDISSLANLPALTTLSLHRCSQLTDISSLANLPALITLDLHRCSQLTDVRPLANLSSLITLNLSNCNQLVDVNPLANLSSLTTLYLSSCDQLADVSPLANLSSLITLKLHGCNRLTVVNLANLPALTTLYLSSCSQLVNVNLVNLLALIMLDLNRCNNLISVNLANLSSLTALDLSYCTHLTDVTPLAKLSTLTVLKMYGCDQLMDMNAANTINCKYDD